MLSRVSTRVSTQTRMRRRLRARLLRSSHAAFALLRADDRRRGPVTEFAPALPTVAVGEAWSDEAQEQLTEHTAAAELGPILRRLAGSLGISGGPASRKVTIADVLNKIVHVFFEKITSTALLAINR